MVNQTLIDFYKGKRVFITGHTGFKGSWLSRILVRAGAEVTGYALDPPDALNLWALLGMEGEINSVINDVRDFSNLKQAFDAARPEIVIHMAAQPIVREGYRDPAGTYGTNVMGTVNLLECVRLSGGVRSVLNVTTDKVYLNDELLWGCRENDVLNGFDPYSNSKSCSELATETYRRCFLEKSGVSVSTARAGNVIGGGDFAKDRIIPDCVRAVSKDEPVILRSPGSVRPYQHVLEALGAYLLIAKKQYESPELASCYNVGPDDTDCVTTGHLADVFCKSWGGCARWESREEADAPHESGFLKLDCTKIKTVLGWRPAWDVGTAVSKVVEWEKARLDGEIGVREMTDAQIDEYFKMFRGDK